MTLLVFQCTASPGCGKKSPAFGSPEWSAAKDFAVMMLLTGGNRYAAQELWLRKVRIHMEAPPEARCGCKCSQGSPAGRGPPTESGSSSPGAVRAQAGDGRPAREARAQPETAKCGRVRAHRQLRLLAGQPSRALRCRLDGVCECRVQALDRFLIAAEVQNPCAR